ncbi:DUF2489 domain-containing protein [Halomonas sp. PR-M31]|uniref:DUF2489 domain-containing protein n=1 Tax=Halomonas sp. PR-M31 TaxID=1471202 RepID=UPI0006507B95|nr:DUF2489 domain-containing protein [Halomonas sp. PR-M31]
MSEVLAWGLLGIAVIVVVALAGYALKLLREVKRRQAFREDEIRRANNNCLESLEMIAQAMLADQVDLIEGSLRCKVLLEIIDPALLERRVFSPFGEVYQRTAHLHTHSARRALTPRERFKEDRERITVEQSLQDDIRTAASAVLDFKRQWEANER